MVLAAWLGLVVGLVLALALQAGAYPVQSCTEIVETVCKLTQKPALQPKVQSGRPQKRLAILVSGLRDRFYPVPTLRHVVAPAAAAGWEVDYFVSLSAKASPRFNGTAFGAHWYRPVPNPKFGNWSAAAMRNYLNREARHFGARRSILLFRDHDIDAGHVPQRRVWRSTRVRALRTVLRFKFTELLWNWTMAQGFNGYDLVMVIREDTYFVADVDLSRFEDRGMMYSAPFGQMCMPLSPATLNDRVMVFGGKVAGSMLRAYTDLIFHPSKELDHLSSPEVFLTKLAKVKRVPFARIPFAWLPFWTVTHMHGEMAGLERPMLCFRGLKAKDFVKPFTPCVDQATLDRVALAEPDAPMRDEATGLPIIPFCDNYVT